MVKHFHANKNYITIMSSETGDNKLTERIYQTFFDIIIEYVNVFLELEESATRIYSKFSFLTNFSLSGLKGIIVDYVNSGCVAESENVAKVMSDALMPIILYVHKYKSRTL